MISGWTLPRSAVIGGRTYPIHPDYRDVLEIFSYLEDPELPEAVRWHIALALFYEGQIPPENRQEALEYLARFLNGGQSEPDRPAPKLLDWQQDAAAIVADVNRVAGQEIRALPFLHWWSFLAFFHAIGQGQLSAIVTIRDKLRRGRPLEAWEKEFYRENKHRIDLKKRYSPQELAHQQQLQQLLGK